MTKKLWQKSAILGGKSQEYRYHLARQCSGQIQKLEHPEQELKMSFLLVVMLNPSTADAEKDDNTIARLMNFARRHGFERLEVVNLFALRTSKPSELDKNPNPAGEDNPKWVEGRLKQASKILLAYGTNSLSSPYSAILKDQLKALGLVEKVYCFRKNKDGNPTHPSRHMTDSSTLIQFNL
jgi:hypothetical protein